MISKDASLVVATAVNSLAMSARKASCSLHISGAHCPVLGCLDRNCLKLFQPPLSIFTRNTTDASRVIDQVNFFSLGVSPVPGGSVGTMHVFAGNELLGLVAYNSVSRDARIRKQPHLRDVRSEEALNKCVKPCLTVLTSRLLSTLVAILLFEDLAAHFEEICTAYGDCPIEETPLPGSM